MTWILRLIFLAVLLSILYALMPEGRLRGVLSCVMGLVLLLNLIQPVGHLVKGNRWTWFSDIIMENTGGETSEEQNEILTQYKEKCQQAIVSYASEIDGISSCRAEVLVEETWGSSNFGSLQHVYLYVMFGEKKENQTWIPPIIIFPETESSDLEKQEKMKTIQSSIASWLQIDLTCVTVFEEA